MVMLANPRGSGRGRGRCAGAGAGAGAGFGSVIVSDGGECVEEIDVMVEFVAVLPFDLKQVCVV